MRYFVIGIVVLLVSACSNEYDDWHSQCMEKAALSAKSDEALKVLLNVCIEREVPKKCRAISQEDIKRYEAYSAQELAEEQKQVDKRNKENAGDAAKFSERVVRLDFPSLFERSYLSRCYSECDSASFFTKRFGSCAKG